MGDNRAPFLPSTHGCTVSNNATHRLPITIAGMPIARVTGGLCGGMVLDSLRAWQRGAAAATASTADLSRIFAAQLRSFQIPSAPLAYLRLQRPNAHRARTVATDRAREHLAHSVARNEPVPVALVSVLSASPLALSAHHVVLAYRLIEHDAARSEFAIYDPNYPGDDDITLQLSPTGNLHSRGRTVHAAFALSAR